MNNIKQRLDRIEIPKELHERSKLGVKRAKLEQPKRKLKSPLVAAVMVTVLGCGFLLSPTGQAMFEGLFQISKFEKSANNEEISFGYHFDNLDIYEENDYDSLNEIEDTFNVNIPFPEQLLIEETNKETIENRVSTDENGDLSSYRYNLSTPKRSYSVLATSIVDAKAKFSAETTDGTGIEKDIMINGVSSKLLGIKEIDGYTIYIENENWKLIISCFDRASNLKGVSDVKEEEVIKIAESIKW
ncbi:hypothetical protein BABA_05241 [Neobacillus bataviensis LMG 21833]|uniref:DUF4367 domain-containing protein n=1 Tax=Neobacillus bataviensis LMG 21833 TaxID=1117379 RepID=K6EAJ6_9BACI|nr:hypothetical protein [Neobacillus bataviensis]EKN70426.1 hypothetical protein BABA_05241 [Neobacillus bataviensis LMG 21833]